MDEDSCKPEPTSTCKCVPPPPPPPSEPSGPKGVRRPMKYPYTFTAKLVQFPYMHYWRNNWIYRYYVFGVIGSIPVFYYLSNLSNSPANVEKWAKIKRHEEEELKHKFD